MLVNRPGTEEHDAARIDYVLAQIAVRTPDVPWEKQRVLDLAARTGAFSVALAEKGAHVVAVEGRAENINAMPYPLPATLNVINADVREVSVHMGRFDVVLCLGILYHLNAEDAVQLLRRLGVMTKLLIIDTHVSTGHNRLVTSSGDYFGHLYRDETETSWGSIGTTDSWWFNEESLRAVLYESLFNHVTFYDPQLYEGQSPDRRWVIAE